MPIAKKAKHVSFFFFFFFFFYYYFLFPRDFSGTIADTNIINTPPEPFRRTDVPFVGYRTKSKDLKGVFSRKIDFCL